LNVVRESPKVMLLGVSGKISSRGRLHDPFRTTEASLIKGRNRSFERSFALTVTLWGWEYGWRTAKDISQNVGAKVMGSVRH